MYIERDIHIHNLRLWARPSWARPFWAGPLWAPLRPLWARPWGIMGPGPGSGPGLDPTGFKLRPRLGLRAYFDRYIYI